MYFCVSTAENVSLILSLKTRFLEWAQHPLLMIFLSMAAHIVIHTDDTLPSHFRRDSSVALSLITRDTNYVIYIIKCPCGLVRVGKML